MRASLGESPNSCSVSAYIAVYFYLISGGGSNHMTVLATHLVYGKKMMLSIGSKFEGGTQMYKYITNGRVLNFMVVAMAVLLVSLFADGDFLSPLGAAAEKVRAEYIPGGRLVVFNGRVPDAVGLKRIADPRPGSSSWPEYDGSTPPRSGQTYQMSIEMQNYGETDQTRRYMVQVVENGIPQGARTPGQIGSSGAISELSIREYEEPYFQSLGDVKETLGSADGNITLEPGEVRVYRVIFTIDEEIPEESDWTLNIVLDRIISGSDSD